MFQVMLKFEEFFIFVIKVHTISQNISLVQNKIFVSFPTKIMITFTENKKFDENKVAIFTFFEVFKILFFASHDVEKYYLRCSFQNRLL